MEKHKWRGIYTDGTPKLMHILQIVEERLSNDFPSLLNHFYQNDLSIAATFSPVFITLFIYQVPLAVSTRFFEFFMLDGEKAIF